MKKDKHEGPPKYLGLICIASIYVLARLSIDTGRSIFFYLIAIPGLLAIVMLFDELLNL